MSIKIMSAVWELDIPATSKLVLLALADHADDDGFCYPGKKYVGMKCSLSDNSVTRHLHELQDAGLLDIESKYKDNGGQTANLYKVMIPSLTPPPKSDTPPNKDESSVESPTTKPRARKNPPIDPEGSSDLRANDDDNGIRSCEMVKALKDAIERNPDDKLHCRWYHVLINIDIAPFTILTWFSSFIPIKLVRGVLTIATESEYHYDWCRGHYLEELSAMKVKLELSEGVPIEQS